VIRCSTCGRDAPDQSKHCPICGGLLTAGDETIRLETVAMAEVGAGSAPRVRTSAPLSRLATTSTPDEGRFLPGTLIAGRYRIIGLLGRGGMGEVYRATDLTLAQSVALKFLPETARGNERLLERFHNEVRIARQVSHPNVCRVYDIGEAEGVPFISMEYVDGEDLASLLQRIGRLPADKALEIARKICAGIAAAHERGIIHRDLKPHNVMLNRRGEVVVMDFGLAAVADELRGAEARSGTPAYMSPEQLRGDSVTPKSDIYALGLIIYELFTGRRPFEADSASQLLEQQETSRPASLTSVVADADPAVEKVVLRCLHPDPAQRPSNALAVAAALPGGDPLAAALAAGETPSPELVAAAGETEGLALKYALPCLVFVLLGIAAFPFVMQRLSMLAVAPMELPPAVLEERAREIAVEFGYAAKPVDSAQWLRFGSEMVSHFEKLPGRKDWQRILTGPAPYELVYRQSPRYLESSPDGVITTDRPPMSTPGMVTVVVDSSGRLLNFQAVAPREDSEASPQTPLDPAVVFRRAGLEIAQFTETAPGYVPVLAFDARRAWTGTYPGLANTRITVELATWRGRVSSLFIRFPWTELPKGAEPPASLANHAFTAFEMLFLGTALFCIVYFARRNLKRGRGDRRGAFRLAAFCMLLIALRWICVRHMMPRTSLIGYAFEDMSVGLAVASIIWLLYIALEPAVRARWPHTLITWNRLLAGKVRDAQVGSHILIGMAIAMVLQSLFTWRLYWAVLGGAPPDAPNLAVLSGVRPFLGNVCNLLVEALQTGLIIFFLLCGVRQLVRRDWAAAIVAGALLSIQQGLLSSTNLALDVTLHITVFTAFAFILLRLGLVPAIAGIILLNTLGNAPIGSDAMAWYTPTAVLMLATLGALAVYGFARSQIRVTAETGLYGSAARSSRSNSR
jgi:predicted Ser/Thr protein kinase